MLFTGSYVGLQFYKGTLNTPTVSSTTNPSTPNSNSITNTTNKSSNSTATNTTSSNNTSTNTTNPQKLQVLVLSDNPTYNFENKANYENIVIVDKETLKEQMETQTKNITKNYLFQTTTTNSTNSNTNSTIGSNANEKACFEKAYTYLNTSFIVIGGAILFINGNFILFLN